MATKVATDVIGPGNVPFLKETEKDSGGGEEGGGTISCAGAETDILFAICIKFPDHPLTPEEQQEMGQKLQSIISEATTIVVNGQTIVLDPINVEQNNDTVASLGLAQSQYRDNVLPPGVSIPSIEGYMAFGVLGFTNISDHNITLDWSHNTPSNSDSFLLVLALNYGAATSIEGNRRIQGCMKPKSQISCTGATDNVYWGNSHTFPSDYSIYASFKINGTSVYDNYDADSDFLTAVFPSNKFKLIQDYYGGLLQNTTNNNQRVEFSFNPSYESYYYTLKNGFYNNPTIVYDDASLSVSFCLAPHSNGIQCSSNSSSIMTSYNSEYTIGDWGLMVDGVLHADPNDTSNDGNSKTLRWALNNIPFLREMLQLDTNYDSETNRVLETISNLDPNSSHSIRLVKPDYLTNSQFPILESGNDTATVLPSGDISACLSKVLPAMVLLGVTDLNMGDWVTIQANNLASSVGSILSRTTLTGDLNLPLNDVLNNREDWTHNSARMYNNEISFAVDVKKHPNVKQFYIDSTGLVNAQMWVNRYVKQVMIPVLNLEWYITGGTGSEFGRRRVDFSIECSWDDATGTHSVGPYYISSVATTAASLINMNLRGYLYGANSGYDNITGLTNQLNYPMTVTIQRSSVNTEYPLDLADYWNYAQADKPDDNTLILYLEPNPNPIPYN